MDSAGIVLLLLVLVAFSAFFSASETAYTSVSRVRLKTLANTGSRRATLALKLSERYDALISTILIGNNIVNILSTSLATVVFIRFFGDAGVSVSTVVMTVVILMFGEITPKCVARERGEGIALAVAPPLMAIMKLLTPLVFLSTRWRALVGRVMRPGKTRGITAEELLTFVEEAQSEGEINESEGEIIRSAIAFDDLTAQDILTPRVDLAVVHRDDTPEQIADTFRACGYSRLPVCGQSVDDIVGVLHERDFFLRAPGTGVEELMTSPEMVPPSVRLPALLQLLQRTKTHMAIVIDEYGGVQGVVTVEDILEELVGEIWDEHDQVCEEIVPLSDGATLAAGSASLERLLARFGVEREFESTTVGGWVSEELGRLPVEGDSFTCEGLKATVEKTQGRRTLRVRVERAPQEERGA